MKNLDTLCNKQQNAKPAFQYFFILREQTEGRGAPVGGFEFFCTIFLSNLSFLSTRKLLFFFFPGLSFGFGFILLKSDCSGKETGLKQRQMKHSVYGIGRV